MEALIIQLIGSAISGLVAWSVNGMRSDIKGLRSDLKEERDARGEIEERLAAVEARCEERHKEK
ncbi:hypothetical protein [Geobacter sp. SVR]|uniref:hypothetical protein n=1 Tax=Geobacter sp. SVR TaxID=2495594 RepID=UPI00143F0006|nr:hypothetical protein [Geobacter sp. SVR]BCS53297.1 hypothetical protein GSVR_16050 [Geobacter sp. SVR]GCF85577.1 hypothetical protein GSbR_21770 [Geobacter sp. SVR]